MPVIHCETLARCWVFLICRVNDENGSRRTFHAVVLLLHIICWLQLHVLYELMIRQIVYYQPHLVGWYSGMALI